MAPEVSRDALRRLAVADRILREPDLVEAGAWPRACTWLIRLALEHALDDFWDAHRAEVRAASRRAQLLTLTRTVDADLGRRATELWHQLSRAAHHHAYELAPTAAELREWHDGVTELLRQLERAATPGTPRREDDGLDGGRAGPSSRPSCSSGTAPRS